MDAQLEALRLELDALDAKLMADFQQRMALSRQIAQAKKSAGMPVFDAAREAIVLETRLRLVRDTALSGECEEFVRALMRLSKQVQRRALGERA